MAGEEEGFLARWSGLKRAAKARPEAAPPGGSATPSAGTVSADSGASFDPRLLPDIETLDAGSDITAFLDRAVPDDLRNAALRRVWSADPAIRDFIGPVDYGWDFNNPDSIPGFSGAAPEFDVAESLRSIVGAEAPPRTEAAGGGGPASGALLDDAAARRQAGNDGLHPGSMREADVPGDAEPDQQHETARQIPHRRHGGALPE